MPAPAGEAWSPHATSNSGRTYAFETNADDEHRTKADDEYRTKADDEYRIETAQWDFGPDGAAVTVRAAGVSLLCLGRATTPKETNPMMTEEQVNDKVRSRLLALMAAHHAEMMPRITEQLEGVGKEAVVVLRCLLTALALRAKHPHYFRKALLEGGVCASFSLDNTAGHCVDRACRLLTRLVLRGVGQPV